MINNIVSGIGLVPWQQAYSWSSVDPSLHASYLESIWNQQMNLKSSLTLPSWQSDYILNLHQLDIDPMGSATSASKGQLWPMMEGEVALKHGVDMEIGKKA